MHVMSSFVILLYIARVAFLRYRNVCMSLRCSNHCTCCWCRHWLGYSLWFRHGRNHRPSSPYRYFGKLDSKSLWCLLFDLHCVWCFVDYNSSVGDTSVGLHLQIQFVLTLSHLHQLSILITLQRNTRCLCKISFSCGVSTSTLFWSSRHLHWLLYHQVGCVCSFRALKTTWEIWTSRWLALGMESQLCRWHCCLCHQLKVIFLHSSAERKQLLCQSINYPLSSTWPHLNSDVGLEKGEY